MTENVWIPSGKSKESKGWEGNVLDPFGNIKRIQRLLGSETILLAGASRDDRAAMVLETMILWILWIFSKGSKEFPCQLWILWIFSKGSEDSGNIHWNVWIPSKLPGVFIAKIYVLYVYMHMKVLRRRFVYCALSLKQHEQCGLTERRCVRHMSRRHQANPKIPDNDRECMNTVR